MNPRRSAVRSPALSRCIASRSPRVVLVAGLLALSAAAHAKPPVDGAQADPVAVAASGSLARKVGKDPDRWIDALVARLVAGTDDPVVKLRRIHDWLALNIAYDAESFLAGTMTSTTWQETLQRGSALCEGYAELFAELGRRAGLQVEVVPGYARGNGFDVTAEEDPLEADHAWNAVLIGEDDWRLVDVTWDAGTVLEGRFVRRYSTAWLAPEPAVFAHTHLPTEDAWQLLPTALGPQAFTALPYLTPPDRSTLTFATPTTRRTTVGESHAVDLTVGSGIVVDAWLERDGVRSPDGTTFVASAKGSARVHVVFPEPGTYVLHIGTASHAGDVSRGVGQLALHATAGTSRRLPVTYASWLPDYALLEPLVWDGTLPHRVSVRLPGVASAALLEGGRHLPMTRQRDTFTIVDDQAWTTEATVVTQVGEGDWYGVVTFPVAAGGE